MIRLERSVAAAVLVLAACNGDTTDAASSTIPATTTVSTAAPATPTTPSTTAATTTTASTTTTTATTTSTTTTTVPTTTTTAPTTTTTAIDFVALGAELATNLGCRNCHSTDGSVGLGPSWKGLGGSTVTLSDGSTVAATDAYIEESIRSPDAKIVGGYSAGVMQSDYGGLSGEDMAALIAYIASR